jgi:hypothetical protein
MVSKRLATICRILGNKCTNLFLDTYIYLVESRVPRNVDSPSGSLLKFRRNTYSQVGQDGIIEEIFKRLNIRSGTFCEFGAWDGFHLSNARKLVDEGWGGVFIEGDSDRFNQLISNYPSSKIFKINAWVGFESPDGEMGNTLRDLLLQYVSEKYIEDLDLLIIDVDGTDLEIALSSKVQPKVMVIEGGSSFVPSINSAFPDAASNFQHPLNYIVNQLLSIGYISVCFAQDLFLVRQDLVESVMNGTQVRSAEELYAENFYSLSRSSRRWQMKRRFNSREIRNFEKEFTGHFHPNPLMRRR